MKNDATNGATNQPVNLDNEDNPDTAVFTAVAPVITSAVSDSTIASDAHFLSSGLKLDTEIFWKGT